MNERPIERLAVIQARMGSTRLPGKVLERIGPRTVLEHVWLRVAPHMDRTVVAFPDTPENAPLADAIEAFPGMVGFAFVGDENDVLSRFAGVAAVYRPHIVVRVTADCPFVDPMTVDAVAETVLDGGAAYASSVPARPPVDGLDVEAFTVQTLDRADRMATRPYDREHVTPWMRRNAPARWLVYRDVRTTFQHRWTLDTPEDLAWFRRIADAIDCTPPDPTVDDLLDLFARRPDLARYAYDADEAVRA